MTVPLPSVRLASSSTAAPPPLRPPLSSKERIARNQAKRVQVSRDFRTDTITIPTDELYELMKNASRGDSVYDEDEDTIELEQRIAEMAGKEAALFCVSGTMTNQLAIRTHLHQPPYSVVTDHRAHVHISEAGGIAFHSLATTNAVYPRDGHHMTVEEVLDECVVDDDIHVAPTKLVCVENTLSGMVFPQSELVRLRSALDSFSIPLHCDGARMWEAMAKTGMSLSEACAPFHTVSLCLSKGLGAPVGSILLGPKDFIRRATWFRKQFGGGIRQAGGLALAASVCLDTVLPQLPRTHYLATKLARALAAEGVQLDLPTETNMVWINPEPLGFSMTELQEAARAKAGITLGAPRGRVVVHYQIDERAIDELVEVVRELKAQRTEEARQWEEQVGLEIAEEIRRKSRLYAEGQYDGRIEGPKRSLPAYGKR
ncbi:hypothetical protein NBRC10513v2_005154 [Rhodotorula toruloides]|uniref:BY PROTMAP: gi/472581932/gb/EMS19640.1/ threonine aldolase [Rhodosporidium toruloides NP11] gi/647394978/emb/CDR36214.1/ RHTO0S01e16754g1_1 [Rhodosporidium toruloides] n=1 Tax=Rhodotorula toruloides TaxID=5286 RepID=A0A0K3C5G1_RHOTO|nr:Pyridoxal phosphate-dependent transferase [Rhodotorula toruloides]